MLEVFKVTVTRGENVEVHILTDAYALADKYVDLLDEGVSLDDICTSEGEYIR